MVELGPFYPVFCFVFYAKYAVSRIFLLDFRCGAPHFPCDSLIHAVLHDIAKLVQDRYIPCQTIIVVDTPDFSVELCEDFNRFFVLQAVPCHRHPNFFPRAILLYIKRPMLLQFTHPFFLWKQEDNAPIIGSLYAALCLFDRLILADGDVVSQESCLVMSVGNQGFLRRHGEVQFLFQKFTDGGLDLFGVRFISNHAN